MITAQHWHACSRHSGTDCLVWLETSQQCPLDTSSMLPRIEALKQSCSIFKVPVSGNLGEAETPGLTCSRSRHVVTCPPRAPKSIVSRVGNWWQAQHSYWRTALHITLQLVITLHHLHQGCFWGWIEQPDNRCKLELDQTNGDRWSLLTGNSLASWPRSNAKRSLIEACNDFIQPEPWPPGGHYALCLQSFVCPSCATNLLTTSWVFVLEAATTTFCPGPLILLLSACGSPWEFPEPSQGHGRVVLSWFGLVIVFLHFSWFEVRRNSVNVLWRRATSFEGLGHQGPDRWAVLRYEYMDKQTLMYGTDESHK